MMKSNKKLNIFLIIFSVLFSSIIIFNNFNNNRLDKEDLKNKQDTGLKVTDPAYQLMITDTDTTVIPTNPDVNIITVEVDDNSTDVLFKLSVAGSININNYYEIKLDYDHDSGTDRTLYMTGGVFIWDTPYTLLPKSSFSGNSLVFVVPKTLETDSFFNLSAYAFDPLTPTWDFAPGDGTLWSLAYTWQVGVGAVDSFLTGVYSDYGVDTNSDGKFEYLAIDIEINVTIVGNYKVYINYLTNSTHFIYVGNVTDAGYISITGKYNITVLLLGSEIFKSKIDGPYTLYQVQLEHDSNIVDSESNPYITSLYSYKDFGAPPAYFTDSYSDIAIDLDGNSLLDYLNFTIELNVSVSGIYTINIWFLLDPLENPIFISNSKTLYLGTGKSIINISISGGDIYSSGLDGPYTIWHLNLQDSSYSEIDSREKPYTTSTAYSYENFEIAEDFEYPLDFNINPDNETLSFGEQKIFMIHIWSRQAVSDVGYINITGIPSEWYDVRPSVYVFPYGTEDVQLNISIPDIGVTPGNYLMKVSIKSSNFNLTKTINVELIIEPYPEIYELFPENGEYLSSGEVMFTWRTSSNCSTEVYLREMGGTYIKSTGEFGIFHSILVQGLSTQTWYEFYVSSLSTAGYRTNSTVRLFYINAGIVFTQKLYNFGIERDYNQNLTVEVKNLDSKSNRLLMIAASPYPDLIIGFVGNGSMDKIISLNPDQTLNVSLMVHAQDAMRKNYYLSLQLLNLYASPDEIDIKDYAVLNLTLKDVNIDFNLTEIDDDPHTLTKTFNLTNYGDIITDFIVFADAHLAPLLIWEPNIYHLRLETGESIIFKAKLMFDWTFDGSESGDIFITAFGTTLNLSVIFQGDGDIFFASGDATFTEREQSWFCTNNPSISWDWELPFTILPSNLFLFGFPLYTQLESIDAWDKIIPLLLDGDPDKFLKAFPNEDFDGDGLANCQDKNPWTTPEKNPDGDDDGDGYPNKKDNTPVFYEPFNLLEQIYEYKNGRKYASARPPMNDKGQYWDGKRWWDHYTIVKNSMFHSTSDVLIDTNGDGILNDYKYRPSYSNVEEGITKIMAGTTVRNSMPENDIIITFFDVESESLPPEGAESLIVQTAESQAVQTAESLSLFDKIVINDTVDSLVIDQYGRRSGIIGGVFIEEIPYALVFNQNGSNFYYIPATLDYNVTVNGTSITKYDLKIFDRIDYHLTKTFTTSNISVYPTTKDSFNVNNITNSLDFITNQPRDITVEYFSYDINDYDFYYKRSIDSGLTWHNNLSLHIPTSSPGLLGTDFLINILPDDSTQVLVYSGTVEVKDIESGRNYTITTDGKNFAYQVWTEYESGKYYLKFMNSSDFGATWNLNKSIVESMPKIFSSTVRLDSNHCIHVAWINVSEGGSIYYMNSNDNGSIWSTPLKLSINIGNSTPIINIQSLNSFLSISWHKREQGILNTYFIESPDNGTTWGLIKRDRKYFPNFIEAYMEIEFILGFEAVRKHDVIISMNDHVIAMLNNTIPEGKYIFPIDPTYLNYGTKGELASNHIELDSYHMNGGHYIINTNARLILRLKDISIPVYAYSQQEADELVKNITHIIFNSTDIGVYVNTIEAPTDMKQGEQTMINATIMNLGDKELTDVIVRFYQSNPDEGGEQIGTDKIIPSIMPGENYVVNISWTHPGDKTYYIYIRINDDGKENYTENNISFKKIICQLVPSVTVLFPNSTIVINETSVMVWIAEDPNQDLLSCDVYYGDGIQWNLIAENIMVYGEPFGAYPWNTTLVPNGDYKILVNVTDGFFTVNDTSDNFFTIRNLIYPIADAGSDQEVNINTLVNFDGSNSWDDIGIVEYFWDFGDGNNATGMFVSHTYTLGPSENWYQRTFTVSLTVTDTDGLKDTDIIYVIVKNPQITIISDDDDDDKISTSEIVLFGGIKIDSTTANILLGIGLSLAIFVPLILIALVKPELFLFSKKKKHKRAEDLETQRILEEESILTEKKIKKDTKRGIRYKIKKKIKKMIRERLKKRKIVFIDLIYPPVAIKDESFILSCFIGHRFTKNITIDINILHSVQDEKKKDLFKKGQIMNLESLNPRLISFQVEATEATNFSFKVIVTAMKGKILKKKFEVKSEKFEVKVVPSDEEQSTKDLEILYQTIDNEEKQLINEFQEYVSEFKVKSLDQLKEKISITKNLKNFSVRERELNSKINFIVENLSKIQDLPISELKNIKDELLTIYKQLFILTKRDIRIKVPDDIGIIGDIKPYSKAWILFKSIMLKRLQKVEILNTLYEIRKTLLKAF